VWSKLVVVVVVLDEKAMVIVQVVASVTLPAAAIAPGRTL